MQQVQNETVILSLHPLLVFPLHLSVPASISRQWPDSFLDSHPQPPLLLTGPHKQGHSDCCKRKMYHLLGNRWQDVSAKSFYFDHKYYCNPAAPIPLPSNWTRRQKATATLAAEEIASSVWWKIHKLLLKNECICSTTWPNMKTNWRQLFSVITYLASGAEIHRLYPFTSKVHIWHYYTSYQFKRSFNQRGFYYCQTALSARPGHQKISSRKGPQWRSLK